MITIVYKYLNRYQHHHIAHMTSPHVCVCAGAEAVPVPFRAAGGRAAGGGDERVPHHPPLLHQLHHHQHREAWTEGPHSQRVPRWALLLRHRQIVTYPYFLSGAWWYAHVAGFIVWVINVCWIDGRWCLSHVAVLYWGMLQQTTTCNRYHPALYTL